MHKEYIIVRIYYDIYSSPVFMTFLYFCYVEKKQLEHKKVLEIEYFTLTKSKPIRT